MADMNPINKIKIKLAINFLETLLSSGKISPLEFNIAEKHIVKKHQSYLSNL